MAVNPSIQLGTDGNWAIKEDNLLAYKKLGSRFFNREFDFSRGTTATFVGEDGLIQESAIDVPRIDFADDTTGHLLLEPQSTNLVTYSEDFSQWLIQRSNISSNQIIAPNGTLTAYKFYEQIDVNVNRYIYIRPTVTAGINYTQSIFAKKGERSWIFLESDGKGAYFDLENGVLGTVHSDITANIISMGNGWYKCSISKSSVATVPYLAYYIALSNNTKVYDGDGTSGIYLWGAQLEQQSYPTSYIPTNGSTVTRNQEICNNSGTASDFNSEEGVLYAEIAALGTGNYKLISLNNGASGNSVTIGFHQGTSNFYFRVASSNGTTTYNTFPIDYDGFNKIALKYKSGDISIFANGTKKVQSSGTFAFASSLNKLNFDYGNGGLPFYGKNKNLKVFKRALTDTELYLLTVTQYESYQEMATALNYTL